ncbi:phosphatase PAP2 family protein [Thiotrichales bacterium 19S3-7]|nr:phosphatase PAP2 family protein [Thiotrichales bacterium 19S3-7]MCF6801075.1 phosphatase PAP2 family protein [Thiotrichales bacterium 19S3-11]
MRYSHFLKKHSIVLMALVTVLIIFLIQFEVEYARFQWSYYLIRICVGICLYFMGYFIKELPNNRPEAFNQVCYYVFTWFSYATFVNLIGAGGTVDLSLVPFPVIDPYLVKIDHLLGFNVIDIMHYTQTNLPYLHSFLLLVYGTVGNAVSITMIALPLINWKSFERVLFIFYLLFAMTFVFCNFFPSINPAYGYAHTVFPANVTQEAHNYIQFRDYRAINPVIGDVSCPSWHVLIALLAMVGWWPIKRFGIRYLGVIYTILITASVFVTGWHYLVDVLGSFIFIIVGFYAANKLFKEVPDYDFSVLKALIKLIRDYWPDRLKLKQSTQKSASTLLK